MKDRLYPTERTLPIRWMRRLIGCAMLIMIFVPDMVLCQISFTAHDITTSVDGAISVYAVDVDGDGDIDVLSASLWDHKIAWYENDGDENFTVHIITTSALYPHSVYAVDVDGDGDIDVLSASGDHKIAWYENDGSESFTAADFTTSADGARSVYAVDMDGDGDIDVLSASIYDDTIAWYENDGSESFTAHTISTSADGAWSVYAVDLDGDDDIDVLSASADDDKIAWYENDGSESFTAHDITTSADYAYSVYAVDVDGDGDMDVLSASAGDDKIAWYENDGSESFTAATITSSADGASSVYAVDMDGDGDMDVLSASYNDDKIAWYENDGSESFTAHTITTSAGHAHSVYAVDVDGDGDIDVLSASVSDDKIAWYENIIPPSPFDLVYPLNDTTIILTRDNFLDTLYFAWNQSVDPGGDEVTYRREMTGDLPEYIRFIVESNEQTTTNMYKVPYHHIEHYMHEAGVELISGTWTIIATDGEIDVYAENGPFTLTIDGSKLNIADSDIIPETFALHGNYPNPFNPTTTISYDLPKWSQVTLGIYDLLGKQIKTLVNQSQDAGNKIAMWDGTDDLGRPVSAGVYLYQIQAGEFTQTRKMLLLK